MNQSALTDRSEDTTARLTIVRPTNKSSSYRCPACGEMVDNDQIADVLEHHQHVLRPSAPSAWAVQTPASPHDFVGTPKTETQPLRVLPEPASRSAEGPARRYGH